MRIKGQVIGVDNVLRNIRATPDKIGIGVSRGLRLAGLVLQRASQEQVPVEFGVLKASAFTKAGGVGLKTFVDVGFTAAYAVYIHENREIWPPGMRLKGQPRQPNPPHKGNYWDPQGKAKPKFLEDPARLLMPTFKKIIVDEVKKVI